MSKRMTMRLVYTAASVAVYLIAPLAGGSENDIRVIAGVVFGWAQSSDLLPGMKS